VPKDIDPVEDLIQRLPFWPDKEQFLNSVTHWQLKVLADAYIRRRQQDDEKARLKAEADKPEIPEDGKSGDDYLEAKGHPLFDQFMDWFKEEIIARAEQYPGFGRSVNMAALWHAYLAGAEAQKKSVT
jgi:hypothetical protein